GERAVLKGHTSTVRGIGFSPDGRTVASVSFDDTLRLWDAAGGKARARFATGPDHVDYVAVFAPDGKTLATGGDNVKLWDVAWGKVLAPFKEQATSSVRCVAFSPAGKRLAAARFDDRVQLWDTATNKPLGTLEGHTNAVYSVAFSPDGRSLASGAGDKTVRLWDGAPCKAFDALRGPHRKAVCFM